MKRKVLLHTWDEFHCRYERLAVPGGWLYVYKYGTVEGSCAFVPDASIEVVDSIDDDDIDIHSPEKPASEPTAPEPTQLETKMTPSGPTVIRLPPGFRVDPELLKREMERGVLIKAGPTGVPIHITSDAKVSQSPQPPTGTAEAFTDTLEKKHSLSLPKANEEMPSEGKLAARCYHCAKTLYIGLSDFGKTLTCTSCNRKLKIENGRLVDGD